MVFLFGLTFANANQWGGIIQQCHLRTCANLPYPSPPGFHQTICPSWPSPKWTTKHNCHRIRAAAALPRFSVGTLARRLMLPKVMVWINAHECFWQKKFYMTWSEAKVYIVFCWMYCAFKFYGLWMPGHLIARVSARVGVNGDFLFKFWWWNFKNFVFV